MRAGGLITASIIIANRNGERFLRQSIDSALSQTRTAEVVVVDDGSDDTSRDVIRSYGDRVVAIFKDWAGQAAAINTGIEASSGDVVFLLDADDWSDPDRVATISSLFEEDGELLWTRHGLRAVDDENRVLVENLYIFGHDHGDLARQVLTEGKVAGTTSGLALRRSWLEKSGHIPIHYTHYADSYLLMRGALEGRGASVGTPLGAHRWHRGSFTSYDWRQFYRARFHLSLRKGLAHDASMIAQRAGGPASVASAETWWQLKAEAEWRKSGLGDDKAWFPFLARSVRALVSTDLPAMRRLALALRACVLSLLPRSLFVKAWWVTHEGRLSILRTTDRERLT